MASTKKLAAADAEQTPDVVTLHCKELGKTQDFTPAHAKALLHLQETKGYDHWQPVDPATEATTTA
jgi:hypothetical protein